MPRRARARAGAASAWLPRSCHAADPAQTAVCVRRVLAGAAYVLIDEVEATIARHKGGNLLAVLDELSAHALANGRVGLLGLDATATQGRPRVRPSNLTARANDFAASCRMLLLPRRRCFPPNPGLAARVAASAFGSDPRLRSAQQDLPGTSSASASCLSVQLPARLLCAHHR